MEFVNETDYDWRALRALNRAAIRLDRRWRSLLLRAMGVLCGLILLRGAWTSGGGAGLLYGLLGALMLVWALFLNEIRAWLVGRFVMKGVARHTARFTDEGYVIANQRGEQSFDYSSVQALCEDGRYFFLMLSRQQGNLFDKQGFHTGTAYQFRAFLERKTGQTMKKL